MIIIKSDNELKNWSGCHQHTLDDGNLLSWAEIDHPGESVNVQFEPKNNMCPRSFSQVTVLPLKRSFKDSIQLCQKLRSGVYVYKEPAKNVLPEGLKILDGHLWAGYTLDTNDNRFKANENGKLFDFESVRPALEWSFGEPNGYLHEQCLALWTFKPGSVGDISCEEWHYTTCMINTKLIIRLQNSASLDKTRNIFIDKRFILSFGQYDTEDFLFRGYSDHIISKNGSLWELKDLKNKTIFSIISHDIPLGVSTWSTPDNEKQSLILNSCKESEFGCNDGTCIPRMDRCDQQPDCTEVCYNLPFNNF